MKKPQMHIKELNLEPHIEGGFFREIYTCPAEKEGRSIASAIYFLLEKDNFSAFHIISQDEQWVHVDGDSIEIHLIDKDGKYSSVKVGTDYENGEVPSFVVPANTYFASVSTGEYSLTVCNVFPAFRYEDFILPKRNALIDMFPQHKEIITKFTRR